MAGDMKEILKIKSIEDVSSDDQNVLNGALLNREEVADPAFTNETIQGSHEGRNLKRKNGGDSTEREVNQIFRRRYIKQGKPRTDQPQGSKKQNTGTKRTFTQMQIPAKKPAHD